MIDIIVYAIRRCFAPPGAPSDAMVSVLVSAMLHFESLCKLGISGDESAEFLRHRNKIIILNFSCQKYVD